MLVDFLYSLPSVGRYSGVGCWFDLNNFIQYQEIASAPMAGGNDILKSPISVDNYLLSIITCRYCLLLINIVFLCS